MNQWVRVPYIKSHESLHAVKDRIVGCSATLILSSNDCATFPWAIDCCNSIELKTLRTQTAIVYVYSVWRSHLGVRIISWRSLSLQKWLTSRILSAYEKSLPLIFYSAMWWVVFCFGCKLPRWETVVSVRLIHHVITVIKVWNNEPLK